MIRRPATHWSGLCVAIAAFAAGGCAPELPPSEDALLYYVRNARLLHFSSGKSDGRVRRLWEDGQEYVNTVLKADAALQKTLNPLREFTGPLSLWPRQDPRWQDKDALTEQLSALVEHVEGGKPDRELLLGKLAEAVAKPPAGLNLTTPDAEAAFVAKVWQALAIHGVDLRGGAVVAQLEEVGAAHLQLARAVRDCTDHFDRDQTGLRFKDAACQQQINEHYDTLQQLLIDRRAALVDYAEQTLATGALRLKKVDKREQRNEYEYLTNQKTYLRTELEAIPKELRAAIKKMQEKLEQLRDQAAGAEDSKLAASITFHEQRLEELTGDRDAWQARIDEILKKTGDQPEPTDTAEE